MAPLQVPLLFHPFVRPMVWGGRRLARIGKTLPVGERCGESWDVSDHPLHRSVVAAGPMAGVSLRTLMEQHRQALLGAAAARYDVFPWLFKHLDASDWLSVQVHPDAASVAHLWPGEGSKTEAWFILDAESDARIYAGLKKGVGPAELRQGVEQGNVQDYLHSFVPRTGDCVFLPAGTVHALGGGILLAEIQQTSDATFRLFDWNRRDAQGNSRKLHIDESFAAIDWNAGPVTPVHAEAGGQNLVRCEFFELTFGRASKPFTWGGVGGVQAVVVIRGAATLEDNRLEPGQVWLLPADLPAVTCNPSADFEFLLVTLPPC